MKAASIISAGPSIHLGSGVGGVGWVGGLGVGVTGGFGVGVGSCGSMWGSN